MIVESNQLGHRPMYVSYLRSLLNDSSSLFLSEAGAPRVFWRALLADRLILSTADDYLILALTINIFRNLLLRKSWVVTIRAEHVIDRSGGKAAIKWAFYRALRTLPLTKVLSIMPHTIEPGLSRLTNGYMYDPAFFELADSIGRNIAGRNLQSEMFPREVTYLGVLSKSRNISEFINLFCSNTNIKARAMGRRALDLDPEVLLNTGHVDVVDSHLDDESYQSVFTSTESVWCAFRADYDNFSGVFCNAVRFGTPVWLTEGSRLHRFAEQHNGQLVYRLKAHNNTFVLFRGIEIDFSHINEFNQNALKHI